MADAEETLSSSAGMRQYLRDLFAPVDQWLSSVEEPVFESIRETLAPINAWIGGLPPSAWHATAVGLFVVSALATLLVPRGFIYASAPSQRLWRDLRIWTIIALLPYMAAYHFLQ